MLLSGYRNVKHRGAYADILDLLVDRISNVISKTTSQAGNVDLFRVYTLPYAEFSVIYSSGSSGIDPCVLTLGGIGFYVSDQT